MRYLWDFNELRNNRKELLNMLSKTEDSSKIDEIKINIEMYNEMLKLANKKVNNYTQFDCTIRNVSINELIKNFTIYYNKEIIPIMNLILPSLDIMNKYDSGTIELFSTNDTNKDIVTITLDFFEKMTTPIVYKQALDLFENNKHFLNINYYKDFNPYPGITFIDGVLNKKYIGMSRANEVLDLPQLTHELFHYLFSDCDVKTLSEHNTTFLTEVEGMFANILFNEYFDKYFGGEEDIDGTILKKYYLECFRSQVADLVIRNGIINAMDENGKVRLSKLNKYTNLYELPTFNSLNDTIPYINTPQETDITYSLSFLTALDIYYIYKYDREFAFYLIKNIRYIKNEDDIISLLTRNNITFFNDEYKNLKDYIGLNKRKIKKIRSDING